MSENDQQSNRYGAGTSGASNAGLVRLAVAIAHESHDATRTTPDQVYAYYRKRMLAVLDRIPNGGWRNDV